MINSLTSLKNILNSYINKEFTDKNFKIDVLNSAFKTSIQNILFTNINFKDPRAFLDGIKSAVFQYMNDGIRKHNMFKVSCFFNGARTLQISN